MTLHRIKFRIMDLCCQVEGELPFALVDSFEPFIVREGEPDLVFSLHRAQAVDLTGYELRQHFEGDLCYWIYEKAGEWMKLCHNPDHPEILRWCAVYRDAEPGRYDYDIFPEYELNLRTFDPFLLPGLPRFLMEYSALLLHASVVRYKGQGILFTAPSGTGKSTQALLWEKYHGAEILNGDRALIRKINESYRVYGSPYAGSSYIYKNESAPIQAVVVLRQGPVNKIREMGKKEKFLNLLSQFLLFRDEAATLNRQMDAIADFIEKVPVFLLECRPDCESTDVLCDFLKEV